MLGQRVENSQIRIFTIFGKNDWQDGRLALAYFSPNYKYLDQLLKTVTNKTSVLNLVFKEFLQTSIPPLISVLYAKGYHDFPLKIFCLTLPTNFVGNPYVFQKYSDIEKFYG